MTAGPERLRRPQNLKPCHEIAAGIVPRWMRVLHVEPHEYMTDTTLIWVASEQSEDGRRPILRRRNHPILSRLAS